MRSVPANLRDTTRVVAFFNLGGHRYARSASSSPRRRTCAPTHRLWKALPLAFSDRYGFREPPRADDAIAVEGASGRVPEVSRK